MRRGTFQLMKSVNKKIILNKIRISNTISRAQIAKETNLTPPTVSSIVKELIEEGLIKESKLGESSGGRKPTMLHINSKAFYVIGVDAGPETVDCILTDLMGGVLVRESISLENKQLTNETFISILKDRIYIMLNHINHEKVIGIGVAMHGVVDVKTGTSVVAPNLNLRHVPIKDALEEEFNFMIKVENDARALALGGSWFGEQGEVKSLVAVNIGRGVGAGIVMNGRIYRGAQDIAGEFGHMTIDLHGDVCECGNRGCLQKLVSGNAIAHRAKQQISDNHNKDDLTAKDVYEMAQKGEKEYINVLKETGEIIGVGLTNFIHLINPEKIILAGGVMKSGTFILPAIKQTIEERALTPDAIMTEVVVTSLGDNATLLGAVSLVLVELFDSV